MSKEKKATPTTETAKESCGKSKKNLLDESIILSKQELNSVPRNAGFFSIRSANETIQEAATRPDPDNLWRKMWYEGEICCLFSDSNKGKSILAVQIGEEISLKQKVLYFDFELSDKQFQLRYTGEHGELHHFPDLFFRVEIDREKLSRDNFQDEIIFNIEQTIVTTKSKVVIIDNITWLHSAVEKGEIAGELMIQLSKLKFKHELSMLVVAHTPKRSLTNPITQNDLGGSKKLFNFFDSCFAIGESAKDPNLRYIKQLKVRYGTFTHNADHVLVGYIEKATDCTRFEFYDETATERDHLKAISESDRNSLRIRAIELKESGLSVRDIGTMLGVGKSTISNWTKSDK